MMAKRWKAAYLDVKEVFSEHGRAVVDWDAGAIELAAEHFSADGHSEDITGELAVSVRVVDFGRAFEDLSKGYKTRQLHHVCVDKNSLPGRLRVCQQFRAPDLYGSDHLPT